MGIPTQVIINRAQDKRIATRDRVAPARTVRRTWNKNRGNMFDAVRFGTISDG